MGFGGLRLTYKRNKRKFSACFDKSTEMEDFSLVLSKTLAEGGARFRAVLTPKTEITIEECFLDTDESLLAENRMFLNGFQTWTDSWEASLRDSIPKLFFPARPLMGMYGDYSFYKSSQSRLQSFTYTYVRSSADDNITFYGSLSEKSGYTIFEYSRLSKSLRVIKDCKDFCPEVGAPYVIFDLFSINAEESLSFDSYFALSGVKAPSVSPCTGWTSWYNYYTAVTETDVLQNLDAFSSRGLPIDIFQIDDGYQEFVGDWLRVNGKFPRGMGPLADDIHKAGYKAGLWLAPIICEKTSHVYREHPDWVLCKGGYNPGWSGIFYTLDFYNPEVRDYLREVFDTVLNKWHYDMVKLDFLYAASLPPRRDKTRGQVMCEFFEFLREISGDKIILGCGAPLGCAFGLFDYCRISSDVAPMWEDKFLSAIHYRERVSTLNALKSTVARFRLNGRAFYNDPDVFILRDGGNKLTEDQRYTLFMLNSVLGGLLFTSDNINEYTDSQLELFKTLFSRGDIKVVSVQHADAVTVRYSVGEKSYCLMCNLSPKSLSVQSPLSGLLQKESRPVAEKEKITLRPCQTVCLQCEEALERTI